MHNELIAWVLFIIGIPFLTLGAYLEAKIQRGMPAILIGTGFLFLAMGFAT